MMTPRSKPIHIERPDDPRPYTSSRDHRLRIYYGNCIEVMESLPSRSYRMIFADPPFNIGYEYDTYKDKLKPERYVSWCRDWIERLLTLISYDGSIVVAIGDDHVADLKTILDRSGLTMRNWIIWHYTFGVHCEDKFGRDHTHLLYYVRDPKRFIFNSDAVRIQSERQRLGDKRANSKGRVPGDVWKTHFETQESFDSQVWQFPRLVGNAKERTNHPCQMPESILERLILALTNEGDLILDPFAGSGTTAAVAYRLNRMCDTIELSKDYIQKIIIPRLGLGKE